MNKSVKFLVFSSLLFALLLGNLVSSTCTNSTYSGSGDWVINSTNSPNVCSDMTITMNGNLNVSTLGNLTLNNVTLRMNNSVDRQYGINSFSNFYIYNSNFSALNQNYKISIIDGFFWVDNSTFRGESDSAGTSFMSFASAGIDNLSIKNSHIGYGEVYYAFWAPYQVARFQNGFIENTTFDGANYDLRLYATSNAGYPFQFKNCNWDSLTLIEVDVLCYNCSVPSSFSSSGTVSFYSKNHNRLTNQTFVKGSFNYSTLVYNDFKNEANKSIIFLDSNSAITIPVGVNVSYENITMIPAVNFSNSNLLNIEGKLILNRTNMTLTDIALVNSSNIIANGVTFFHKMYINVRAYLNGVAYENVNITGYDVLGNVIFTNLTNSTGHISRQTITRFQVNDSGLTEYFPFSINSSEMLGQNYSRRINITTSSSINIPEDLCEFPSGGDWTINDGNKICEDRIMLLTGNINITSGYNLILINSSLNLSSDVGSNSYIYIADNASFSLNNSRLFGKSSTNYDVKVLGSPSSNIYYINSLIDKFVNNTFYLGYGAVQIENSTFMKELDCVDGPYCGIDSDECKFNFLTNDSLFKQVTINRSIFYSSICLDSLVPGGQINFTLIDSDVYDFIIYNNANLSNILINSTLDIKVLSDALENISSTVVNISDDSGNIIYSGTTDSNGEINSISLTYRNINKSSDITNNYSLVANGKTFNLSMGMPRAKFNERQIVVGTYNQNYEEKLSRVPYLYDFGFTMHDDADTFDVDNGDATYEGFYDYGFLTSVSQWAWDDPLLTWQNKGFSDYSDNLEWFLDLKNKGFELALHSTTETDDWRNETLWGFGNWSELIGFPMMYIEHSSNREHLASYGADPSSEYYLLDIVNTSNVSYYWLLERYEDNGKWRTTPENSSFFYNGWKGYQESIDPVTGERWSYGEISMFPNYTNEKALLPLVSIYGTSINLTSMIGKIHLRDAAHIPSTGFRQLYTPSHIFDLQETKDLTIAYTHSSSFEEFNRTLQEASKYDGYFVPAGTLLDYSKQLEKVSIVGGDKIFTVANNGDSEIEGVVVYPDTNGTIINVHYANTSDGLYLLSVGLDEDEMMLPPLGAGDSLTVNYDIGGTYDSDIPKIVNISNSNVELRNAVYNSTGKKTEFKIGLDRITTYNSTNSTPRYTNITLENLDPAKSYVIERDGETWTNYSWDGDTLYIWTFMSTHNFSIQEKSADGVSCAYASSCLGGYCNSGICASSAASSQETASNPGTSSGATFRPSENNLNNGFSTKIKETQKVEIPVGDSGNKKQIVVESVDGENVIVSANGENYNLNKDESAKIDLDNDGYYDVEVSINGDTVNGYANLEFILIHEEVPSEVEEEKNENILDEIPDVIKKIDWKVYALIGVVIVLIVLFALLNKNVKLKRRHMLFGY